jgi:hypothetical protein
MKGMFHQNVLLQYQNFFKYQLMIVISWKWKIENCLRLDEQVHLTALNNVNQKIISCETHEHNLNLITVSLLVAIIGFIGIIISQTIKDAPLFSLLGLSLGIIGSMIILYRGRSWVHNVCIEKDHNAKIAAGLGKYFYDKTIPLQKIAKSSDSCDNIYQYHKFSRDPFDCLNVDLNFPEKLKLWDEFDKSDVILKLMFTVNLKENL